MSAQPTPQKPSRILRLGKGSLNCVAWSPDRQRLALGGDDTIVYVFTPKGELHWRRKKHTAPIESLAWSPNGRYLASGADDGTIRLWSLDGAELRCIEGHDGFVASVAWSPDSLRIASGSDDRTIRLWSATNGAELRRLEGHTHTLWSVAWSPNGEYLASGSGDRCVCVWSALRGTRLHVLTGHTNQVTNVAWSPDSSRLVSCARDRSVRVWAIPEGVLHQQVEYDDPILSMAWSPDGHYLALGGARGRIRLWSLDATFEHVLKGHEESIWGVAWSPDGSHLAAVARDGMLALWEVTTADAIAPQTMPNAIQWIARQAATVGRRAPPWAPQLPATDAIGAPLGTLRAAASVSSGAGAPCLALSPDGAHLASGHLDGHLRCWDLLDGHLLWSSPDLADSRIAQDIAWSPDGKTLATGAADGAVSLWSSIDGTELHRLPGHRGPVSSVAWSPDGRYLASGSADHTVRIWEMEGGIALRCLRWLKGHTDVVQSIAWSPDAQYIASGSQDGTIRIWSVSTDGKAIARLAPAGERIPIYSVAWSPHGDRIAAGAQDHTIRLWSSSESTSNATATRLNFAETGAQQLDGHVGAVLSVVWSPDGTRLASGSMDATVRIWDLPTGGNRPPEDDTARPVRCFTPQGYTWRLVWEPNGHFLVSSHAEDMIHLWDTRVLLTTLPLKRSRAAAADAFQPTGFSSLPAALLALHQLGIYPPLSLVRDLDLLLADGASTSIATLTAKCSEEEGHATVQHLRALRWPSAARTGMIAWLLRDLPDTEAWRSPPELTPSTLRSLLATALTGEVVPPQAPLFPIAFLRGALQRVDPRTLTLMAAIGADAVAADPSLLLRLAAVDERPDLEPLSGLYPLRHGLRYPITPLPPMASAGHQVPSRPESPPAHGRGAAAPSRPLIPSPPNGAGMDHKPHLRPTVLVLDCSPTDHPFALQALRSAAHAVAVTLRRVRLPVALVCAGGTPTVHFLEHPADLLLALTVCRTRPAEPAATLAVATAIQRQMKIQTPTREPILLLLAQPQWGAASPEPPITHTPSLRALFIQEATATHGVPPLWRGYCERALTLTTDQFAHLPETLGRLIG